MSERTPLLAAEHGPPIDAFSPKTSGCVLSTTNCFLSDGSSKNNAEHRKVQRKLLIACILCVIFMVVEVVGGYLAHSIAIMSDAAHMLSDVAGFAVSLFAAWAVTRKSHVSYSFGYHRIEILGALASVLAIWAVTGALVFEAVMRMLYPEPVNGKLMFLVACAGIAFNLVIAVVLAEHHVHGPGSCHSHGHTHGHSHGLGVQDGAQHRHSHSGDGSGASERSSCSGLVSGEDDQQAGESCCIITMPLASPAVGAAAASVGPAGSGVALPVVSALIREGGHEVPLVVDVQKVTAMTVSGPAVLPTPESQATSVAGCCSGGAGAAVGAGGGVPAPEAADGSDREESHGHGHGREHGQGHVCRHGSKVSAVMATGVTNEAGPKGTVAHSHSSSDDDDDGIHHHLYHHEHSHCHKHKHGAEASGHGHGHGHEHSHGHGHEHSYGHGHGHSHGHGHGHSHGHGHRHGHSHAHGHGHGRGHSHGHDNINLRSALLHVVGDLLQSIGVAAAGGLIWWKQDDPRWQIADPICTFVFAVLVVMTTRGIIAEITHTLMERTPQHVNLATVTRAMTMMDGILDVHDLHVWNLSMGLPILTAHVHIAESANADAVLRGLEAYVRDSLGIQHSTIQICNYQGAAVAVTSAVAASITTSAIVTGRGGNGNSNVTAGGPGASSDKWCE
ncbi:hypothetical protein VaNZ11_001418 [Volvox africanus]|uniref:Uncharacterized protein n=1 Tax=Volvox africanus TaxID=51714 RepID=A0ABQ5RR04_9CHLO|nr:hypothetical protein VaNZ11_001418 [Volvox africanus]